MSDNMQTHQYDHRFDRRRLVGRFLEAKALGEGLVIVHVELESMTLARRALRVEVEQLRRGVVRALSGALFAFSHCPLPSSCSGAAFPARHRCSG